MRSETRCFQLGGLRLRTEDIAAILVFAAFALCFFISAPYGLTESDEPLYQVYVYRLLKGDRLFFDDWTLTPFSTIFNFLPFGVYYCVTGGTGGMLLALRYFFAVCKLAVFALSYAALRSRGYWAVLAASVFTGAFAFGIKSLNYYFVCGCALLFTGWVLFIKKESSPFLCGVSGFVFSMAVLAEPSMGAIWIIFTVLVAIRWICKKKNARFLERYDFILRPSVWRSLFFGIAAAVGLTSVLCAVFFMRVPPAGLWEGFLNALNDPERSGGISELLSGRLSILSVYARIYNPAALCAFLALIPAAFAAHRINRKTDAVFLPLLFVLYAFLTVRTLLYPMRTIGYAVGETVCHPLPLGLAAVVFYANAKQKDRRLFAFLLFGFAAMLCGDMISMTAFGAFSEVIAVPAVLLLRSYFRGERGVPAIGEPQQNVKPKKVPEKRKTVCRLACVLAAFAVFAAVAEAAHCGYLMRLHETERLFTQSDQPLDNVIACGVYKGVRTTAEIAEAYEKSVRDARKIAELCENRLYVADLAPTVYLDADVPIAAHSPFYYYQEGWDRVSLWWEMHPDKLPDVVYIPDVKLSFLEYPDAAPGEKLAYLRARADITEIPGEIGTIVKINEWR